MVEKISGEFLQLIRELEPVEFLGLSKLLGVSLLDGEDPKDFFVLLSEDLKSFEGLARKKRREILRVLRQAQKEKNQENKTKEKKRAKTETTGGLAPVASNEVISEKPETKDEVSGDSMTKNDGAAAL